MFYRIFLYFIVLMHLFLCSCTEPDKPDIPDKVYPKADEHLIESELLEKTEEINWKEETNSTRRKGTRYQRSTYSLNSEHRWHYC